MHILSVFAVDPPSSAILAIAWDVYFVAICGRSALLGNPGMQMLLLFAVDPPSWAILAIAWNAHGSESV